MTGFRFNRRAKRPAATRRRPRRGFVPACESLERRRVLSTYSLVDFGSYTRPFADGHGVSGAAVLDANLDGRMDLLLTTHTLTSVVSPGKTLIGFNTQAGSLQFSDMGANQSVHWGPISSGDLGFGSAHPEVVLDAGRVVSFRSGNTWSQVARYDVPNTYSTVGISDFDSDSRPDVVSVAGAIGSVSISRQQSGGVFSTPVTTNYGSSSSAGFAAPFDNDQFADLLVMRPDSFPLPGQTFSPLTIDLWRGTSTGQFVFDQTLVSGLSGRLAGVTDLNGDGRKDLLFQTGNGSVLSVYLQNSSRGITKVQDITVSTTLQDGSYFQTVAPFDFTGDGRADIAVWTWEGIKLYTAGANGALTFAGSRTGARPTYYMVTGDFNGDGRDELVVPAYNQGRVFVDIYDVVPTAAAPGAPTGVTGTAGNSQVSLSWTAPASNGGATITDYVIQYSSNAGSSWTTFNDAVSASTSTTVTGLVNGTGYIFRVAAKNSVGQGGYSSASSTATPSSEQRPAWTYDSTFGSNGFSAVHPLSTDNVATSVDVDQLGRIVVAGMTRYVSDHQGGQALVVRLHSTGAIDTSFGNAGIATPSIPGVIITSVKMDASNRVLLSGSFMNPQTNSRDSMIARLTSDGTLDTSFSGDGILDFSFTPVRSAQGDIVEHFSGIDIDSRGRIVVGGFALMSSVYSQYVWTAARLHPDGTFDAQFSGDGRTTIQMGISPWHVSQCWNVFSLPGDRLALTGHWDNYRGSGQGGLDPAVAILTSNGELDPTFGKGGSASLDVGVGTSGFAAAIDQTGKFVVGRGKSVRFSSSGVVDSSYGMNGILSGQSDAIAASASVSGTVQFLSLFHGQIRSYKTDGGAPDTSFFENGYLDLPLHTFWHGSTAMRMRNGRLLVVGKTGGQGTSGGTAVVVAALRPPDSTPPAPVVAPGAPTGVTGTAGNSQVSLSWTAPTSTGGAAITDYVIQFSSNAGSSWTTFNDGVSSSTSTTVTGLTNGTGHIFRVAAANSVGQGIYSVASSTVTPTAPVVAPGAPTNVTGTAGNGQVSLLWTAPASNGGAAVTDYVIQFSSNAGSSWTTFNDGVSSSTSTTVTGLTNGTGYIFRVAAKNFAGIGDYSPNSTSITPAVPPNTQIESDGVVTLAYDWEGRLYAGATPIKNGAVTIDYHSMSRAGWQAIAAEPINGTNTVAWRHQSGNLHFWRLSGSWSVERSEGWQAPGSPGYFATESDFGMDFNGDGVVGSPFTTIESVGIVHLGHDESSRLYANGTRITLAGQAVNYSTMLASGWQAVAAETVNGINTLVWRHSSGRLHFWRLSGAWENVSSDGWHGPRSPEYHATEIAFGMDFNGDGTIGPRLTPIESVGSTVLSRDAFGRLYAGSSLITLGGAAVDFNAMNAAGWRAVAAEAINGINSLVWRHANGSLHFWRLSATWAHVSSDGWQTPRSNDARLSELAYGMDLNGNGRIGA